MQAIMSPYNFWRSGSSGWVWRQTSQTQPDGCPFPDAFKKAAAAFLLMSKGGKAKASKAAKRLFVIFLMHIANVGHPGLKTLT